MHFSCLSLGDANEREGLLELEMEMEGILVHSCCIDAKAHILAS